MAETRARIVKRTRLYYEAGADPSQDRPAHVRAGSGVVVVDTARGRRLLVIQDDASFLALVDPESKIVDGAIALPAGPGGRRTFDEASGTKKDKLDLESVFVLPADAQHVDTGRPLVVAFGSGSTAKRERIVLARVDRWNGDAASVELDVVDAHALYDVLRAQVRAQARDENAELNLEGAALVPPAGNAAGPSTVQLFQRGNGAGAVDATFEIDVRAFAAYLDGLQRGASPNAPVVIEAARWELGTVPASLAGGALGAARLTFTDAHCAGGRIYVVAAAEASPNAVDDGEIVGCAFGVLGRPLQPIVDENGAIYVGKPEGLALDPRDPKRGWLVVDKDDPAAAAELLDIVVE